MSNENEKPDDAPKDTAPDPPAPKPEGEPVTRHEFNGVVEAVGKLTENVAALVDRLTNSTPGNTKPTKPPWTHIGSKVKSDNE